MLRSERPPFVSRLETRGGHSTTLRVIEAKTLLQAFGVLKLLVAAVGTNMLSREEHSLFPLIDGVNVLTQGYNNPLVKSNGRVPFEFKLVPRNSKTLRRIMRTTGPDTIRVTVPKNGEDTEAMITEQLVELCQALINLDRQTQRSLDIQEAVAVFLQEFAPLINAQVLAQQKQIEALREENKVLQEKARLPQEEVQEDLDKAVERISVHTRQLLGEKSPEDSG